MARQLPAAGGRFFEIRLPRDFLLLADGMILWALANKIILPCCHESEFSANSA